LPYPAKARLTAAPARKLRRLGDMDAILGTDG
jgi:hypothetical protein